MAYRIFFNESAQRIYTRTSKDWQAPKPPTLVIVKGASATTKPQLPCVCRRKKKKVLCHVSGHKTLVLENLQLALRDIQPLVRPCWPLLALTRPGTAGHMTVCRVPQATLAPQGQEGAGSPCLACSRTLPFTATSLTALNALLNRRQPVPTPRRPRPLATLALGGRMRRITPVMPPRPSPLSLVLRIPRTSLPIVPCNRPSAPLVHACTTCGRTQVTKLNPRQLQL